MRGLRGLSIGSACLLASSALVLGGELKSTFDFDAGDFTLGSPPSRVQFLGGEARDHSWRVGPRKTGSVHFETPASSVRLLLRNERSSSSSASLLTFFDPDGDVIQTYQGSGSWTEVRVDAPAVGIGSITLENLGALGHAAIDEFSCEVCISVRIDDPIPEPIPLLGATAQLRLVASGFTAPNGATFAPVGGQLGSRRLFVIDQPGIVWAVDVLTGDKMVFLDVSSRLVALRPFDERGLLGIAFHPAYASNGLFYTYTSEPVAGPADFSTMPPGTTANHQSVILEWRVPSPNDVTSTPTSFREILRIDQPQSNHNAGALAFDRDALLYVGVGDGGSADDQGLGHGVSGNGQDPQNPLGSILRIDPLGDDSANGQYGIPPTNPFVGQAGFLAEIFAYGFRNPFRFSFDRVSGALIAGDVGQNDVEEVDLVTAGGNYGWNFKEGSFFFDPNGDGPGFVSTEDPGAPPGLIDPVLQYDHDEGVAVIGGFVYRGSRIPALQGRYVFGDLTARLFVAGMVGRFGELRVPGGASYSLLGFGEDQAGELYILANQTGGPSGTTGVVATLVNVVPANP